VDVSTEPESVLSVGRLEAEAVLAGCREGGGFRGRGGTLRRELTEPLEATFTFVVIYWERDGLISWVEVAPSIGAEVDDGEARTLAETADGRLVELLDSAD